MSNAPGTDELTFREVLRSNKYRWFLLAIFLDQVCNALWLVTLGWVAAQAPTPLWSGLILFAGGIPLVILLLLGGLWVDRHGTTKVALFTLSLRVLVMVAWTLVVLSGVAPVAVVVVAAAAVGLIAGVHEPAMFAYPTAILPADRGQAAAVTLERVTQRFTQSVGAAGAGFLLGAGGAGAPALVGAVCVLAALGIIGGLRWHLPGGAERDKSVPAPRAAEGRKVAVRGGVNFARHHAVLRYTLPVQCAASVSTSAVLLAALPMRGHISGWTGEQYGTAFAAYGTGITIATIAALRIQRWTAAARVTLSIGMVLVTGVAVVLVGLAPDVNTEAIACGVMGLALGPAGPFLSGYTRAVAAAAERDTGTPVTGRVGSVMLLLTDGAEPVGFLVVAGAAAAMPVQVPTVILGVCTVLVAGWSLWQLRGNVAAPGVPSDQLGL